MAMNEKTRLVKEKTGMTLKALSKEIGYAETSLTCALRGHYQMGYPLAKILAERTGVSPLYFLEDNAKLEDFLK
jgi:lambda repressor-like predicted transcriptional regulator